MTKIDIFSGFLGAGKTTLIKKIIKESLANEKLVLIENEFGDIGIDGSFMQDAGIEVTEMNSGCICCSLVGDFGEALKKVLIQYNPDRILIEPSGVGKLSDVIKAVESIDSSDIALNSFTTVVDAKKCKMYMKNFGEFFNNQIENAGTIFLSHTNGLSEEKIGECIKLIREHNSDVIIVSTDWNLLSGEQVLLAMEREDTLDKDLEKLMKEDACPVCGHHNDHHHEDEHHHGHCDCHEHHHDEHCDRHEREHQHDDHCDCHEHHHHEHHSDESCCGHHHHHGEECCCGHDHEHHHHADDVFTSWGIETARKYTNLEISNALAQLSDKDKFGTVLRAKGIVDGGNEWIHFDYVPDEIDVRLGSPSVIGRICVIGSDLKEENISKLFGIEVK